MDSTLKFMASPYGRLARILAGASLSSLAIVKIADPTLKKAVTLIGVVPYAAGLLDFCLLAALFGYPLEGKDLRAELAAEHPLA